MLPERYCVIDVETTGFSPYRDRIVEIACALVDDGRIVGRWATLVNPGIPIPAHATAVHGIDDAMVADAPDAAWAMRRARRLCKGRLAVAHYARFDLSFVAAGVVQTALCTLRLARSLYPEAPNHKNQTLRHFLNIDRTAGESFEAHRALGDALVSAHVLVACRRRFAQRRPRDSWERFIRERAMVSAGRRIT